jgi:Icc-related predicted phosphoesterase
MRRRCGHCQTQRDILNHAYASDLASVIECGKPTLWVHGHIHRHNDDQLGATRICLTRWEEKASILDLSKT